MLLQSFLERTVFGKSQVILTLNENGLSEGIMDKNTWDMGSESTILEFCLPPLLL